MSQQVRDVYDDEAQFAELLEAARMNAKNDWEENFISDLTEKFKEHGSNMYLSDLQNERVNRIANAGE